MSPENWALIGQGTLMTVSLTLASGLLSLAVGLLLAVMRAAPVGALQAAAGTYTEFFRNIPLLTVLFFIYFGVPNTGLKLDAMTSAIIGLGLYTAAYVAEVLRAGLGTVSKGNLEAARSLGLTYAQMIRYVQLPQALRASIPPLGTLLIALLKNTSLASTVAVAELLYQSDVISSRTFNPDILLITGLVYLGLTLAIGAMVNLVEQRWAIRR